MSNKPIIDALIKKLFEKDWERLKKWELKLIQDNHRYGGMPDGFFYGRRFTDLPDKLANKGKIGNPRPEIMNELHSLISDRNRTGEDEIRIRQALSLVLMGVVGWQDVRNALHDGLAEMLEETKHLPRTKEEAFNLKSAENLQKYYLNEKSLQQYMKLRPLIEQYLTSRLIF